MYTQIMVSLVVLIAQHLKCSQLRMDTRVVYHMHTYTSSMGCPYYVLCIYTHTGLFRCSKVSIHHQKPKYIHMHGYIYTLSPLSLKLHQVWKVYCPGHVADLLANLYTCIHVGHNFPLMQRTIFMEKYHCLLFLLQTMLVSYIHKIIQNSIIHI